MTIETEVAALTTAVNALTTTVNVKKATLDASVSTAAISATASSSSASASATSAQTAQAQASLAQGYAASASSVVQQDLSGITAQALHRSPNAITAQFIYDTSKDSDGGAWTEKCQQTSWYNEALAGKWLGPQDSELNARSEGATLGSELVSNGTFSSGTTGWTPSGASIAAVDGEAVLTCTSAGTMQANCSASVTIGKLYKVTATLRRGTVAGPVYVGFNGISAVPTYNTTNITLTTYINPSFTPVNVQVYAQSASVGQTLYFDNISVREVTALNTASNDYFQLTTDGKFYRLWKNLFRYSEQFEQWGVSASATVLTNTQTAPDGTMTADTVTGSGSNFSGVVTNVTSTVGQRYSASIYVKAGTSPFAAFLVDGGNLALWVNLSTGLVSNVSGTIISAITTNPGNGWFRVEVVFSATGTTHATMWAVPASAAGVYTGTGSMHIWGAQIEYGSAITAYEYKGNIGTTSEIFRGNKADFPRLAAIVAEAGNVNIYDLTEPGRPMWMRIYGGNSSCVVRGNNLTCITSFGGFLYIGHGTSFGLAKVDFVNDKATLITTAGEFLPRNISNRNDTSFVFSTATNTTQGPSVVNAAINAVAMTVLPDAPIDPATSLRVPTIAVATGGGVSVIKHNGTVVNSGTTGSIASISLIGSRMFFNRPTAGDSVYQADLVNITAGFGTQIMDYTTNSIFPAKVSSTGRELVVRTDRSPNGLSKFLTVVPAGLRAEANIRSNFNTGWMYGAIRRAYLSDVTAEGISASELVTNGTFATDVSGWTALNSGSIAWSSGAAVVTGAGANTTGVYQPITCVIGKTYRFQVTCTLGTTTIAEASINLTAVGSGGSIGVSYGYFTSSQTYSTYFVATATTHSVVLMSRGVGLTAIYDNVTVTEAVPDRSYKAASAPVFGTLTKSQLASGTSLVGYSGYSGSNYLREPYSADLDFGTGEWNASAWLNTAVARRNLLTYTNNLIGASWSSLSNSSAITITGSQADPVGGSNASLITFPAIGASQYAVWRNLFSTTLAGTYTASVWLKADTNTSVYILFNDSSGSRGIILCNLTASWQRFTISGTTIASITALSLDIGANGYLGHTMTAGNIYAYGAQLEFGSTATEYQAVVTGSEVSSLIVDRSFSSGPRIRIAMNGLGGTLTAEAFDGTTTRTVTTTAAYNTATWLKAEANYTTDGSLTIRVNGREVAATRGNPLLTLNNTSAPLTIGNNYTLDGPFPGTIALLKLGATVPTPEQAQFMYEQEKQLFRANAQSVLPDAGAVGDMAYDDATDRWVAVSAANESYWTGLVRNTVTPVPAGSYTKIVATSGIELAARSTTNPGVDVTIPAYGLREELVKRAEAAARLGKELSTFDYVGGFTANTTNGNTAITSASTITYPASYIGARISGSGIPANTTIVAVSGTTLYLSAAATATATTVQITFLDFALPAGMEAKTVFNAGVQAREGTSAAFTRLYDGFIETIRFGAAPGYTALVTIQAQRISQ